MKLLVQKTGWTSLCTSNPAPFLPSWSILFALNEQPGNSCTGVERIIFTVFNAYL